MASLRKLPVLACLPLLAACAAVPEPEPEAQPAVASQAPALGKADGKDVADRSCSVVLREVTRLPGNDGNGYAKKCTGGSCNWVFTGHVEVSKDAHPSDAEVHVLYRRMGAGTWWDVTADAVAGGHLGFFSHQFEISEHLWGPDASESELASARVELIPYLKLANGGRLFDHNRKHGDFDVYSFGQAEWFTIGEDQSCQPVAGTLFFQNDWQETLSGALHANGWLGIQYDLERLPQCRATHNGYPAWDTLAHVKFWPGGQLQSLSAREFLTQNGTPTNTAVSKRLELKIPADTTSVELWFENYSGAGNSCQAWDSNYGTNHHFDVLPSVTDPRCRGVERWSQIYGGEPTCTAYAPDEQVDATHCELHLDGIGHGYEGHYGIPFEWLEAWIVAGAQDGELLNVGIYTRYLDPADGATHERFSLGKQVNGTSYRTGFTYRSTGTQTLPSYLYDVQQIAFFADVRRPSGKVVRLWQSRGGQNYGWDDAFAAGTTKVWIPYGNHNWANAAAAVFDAKHACQP